ncbi:MAG: hypothetical protein HC900_07220 [Methylacidiphilales bacterium]|nr:hypothetical protein [Candidatus Methylacidiphilales bacterium]
MAFRPALSKMLAADGGALMMVAALPAQAQAPYPPPRYHNDNGEVAAVLGVFGGIALGAVIAGSQLPAPPPRQCWLDRRKVWVDGHREWDEVEVCR